jgi:hypothetical protein
VGAYELVISGIRCGWDALAQHLVPSSRRIRLLEPGAWLSCEAESRSSLDLLADNRYGLGVTSHRGDRKPFRPLVRLGAFG